MYCAVQVKKILCGETYLNEKYVTVFPCVIPTNRVRIYESNELNS